MVRDTAEEMRGQDPERGLQQEMEEFHWLAKPRRSEAAREHADLDRRAQQAEEERARLEFQLRNMEEQQRLSLSGLSVSLDGAVGRLGPVRSMD